MERCDTLERALQLCPEPLRVSEGLDEHRRVIGVERLSVPRALAAQIHHLLREELSAVPLARSLDLHALSF
jgi:hypothetical protein